jgi:hypothetical protein
MAWVGWPAAWDTYEAICFLTFGRVFTAAQTGKPRAARDRCPRNPASPAGPNPVTVVISRAGFAAGAALAIPVLKAFDGDKNIEDKDTFQVWSRRVSIALAIALVFQAGFLSEASHQPAPGQGADPLTVERHRTSRLALLALVHFLVADAVIR